MKGERPTLNDVAAAAGVSRNTVSLTLQRSPLVRPATAARVWQAVRATGYRANRAARALRSGRSRTLGVVQFDPERYQLGEFYYPVLAALTHGANARGYDVLLLAPRVQPDPDWLREIGHGGRVDGLVFLGARTDREAVGRLAAAGLPVAHVGRREVPGGDLPHVTADNAAGVAMATRHLIDHGHRRIAFAATDLVLESHRDRLDGYRAALAAAGIPVDPALILIQREVPDGAFRLPAGGPGTAPPTGLVTTDSAGWTLLARAREGGRRLPQDLAVVAYNDTGLGARYDPPLTTVDVSREEMGERAAALVIDLIEGRTGVVRAQAVPPRLVVRRSCGCPPGAGAA